MIKQVQLMLIIESAYGYMGVHYKIPFFVNI